MVTLGPNLATLQKELGKFVVKKGIHCEKPPQQVSEGGVVVQKG